MFSPFQGSQKLTFDESAQRQLNNLRKQTCTVSCEFAKTVNSFVSRKTVAVKICLSFISQFGVGGRILVLVGSVSGHSLPFIFCIRGTRRNIQIVASFEIIYNKRFKM